MKAWFMGEVDELFVVDKHPGVRYFGLMENEDQFLQRVLAWFEMRQKYRDTLKNGQEPEDAIAAPLTNLEREDLTAADRLRMTAVSDPPPPPPPPPAVTMLLFCSVCITMTCARPARGWPHAND